MTDCETCKPEPLREWPGPGVPVPMMGTRHRRSCPLLPRFEPSEELAAHLADIRRCEREAWVSAHAYVIGAGQ